MSDQSANTDDRMVDVLGELVAQFGSNFVISLADVAVGSSEAFQVRDGLDIPNDEVAHGVHQ
jgi:hypothetical protein